MEEDNESEALSCDVARVNDCSKSNVRDGGSDEQNNNFITSSYESQWHSNRSVNRERMNGWLIYHNFCFRHNSQVPKRSKQPPTLIYSKRNHVSRSHSDARIRRLSSICIHDARRRRPRNWMFWIQMHSITRTSIGRTPRKSSSMALAAVAISRPVRTYVRHISNAANTT